MLEVSFDQRLAPDLGYQTAALLEQGALAVGRVVGVSRSVDDAGVNG
jgi:hypothetical protein